MIRYFHALEFTLSMINVPNDGMLGTQIPTKTP